MNPDAPPPLPELPPTYYLDNFVTFVRDVSRRYEHLLEPAEVGFVRSFFQLDRNAQCLFVRLISRKGPLFRSDKLAYAEIENLPQAQQDLVRAKMLELNPDVEASQLLGLLTVEELRRTFPGVSRSGKKADLVADISMLLTGAEAPPGPSTDCAGLYRRIFGPDISVIRPAHQETLDRFRLLFFGHLGQDLTEFVLSDLGIFSYENYALDGTAAAFRTREELEELYAAIQFRQAAREFIASDCADLADALLEAHPPGAFPPAQRAFSRALNELGRYAERRKALDIAERFYRRSAYPPARERLARVYFSRGEFQDAVQQCELILAAPWDEQEATCAQRVLERSLKKLKRPVPVQAKTVLVSDTVVLAGQEAGSVEYVALEYLKAHHRCDGWYVENWLFTGLFGLLFWEEIFAPVPDAFYHPFQRRPRDLYYPEFRSKRSRLMDRRLRSLDSGEWRQQIRRIWQEKHGRVNPFVHWPVLSDTLLEQAMSAIPPMDLMKVFERMLADLRNHCTGFPDLVLFHPDGSYELVEVKGPGDRLQDHQVRWLEFFEQEGITARTLYVRYEAEG